MKVTKIGHCCLLIEEQGLRILTDPGFFSTAQNELKNIDVILITHEHQDHFHTESLNTILKNNPDAAVLTNSSVGKLIDPTPVGFHLLVHGEHIRFQSVLFEAFGTQHAVMHASLPVVENTGFLINHRLFLGGDAFTVPDKAVEILALPIAGPWMKLSEAFDYALAIKPKHAFPVHDSVLNEALRERFAAMPTAFLKENGINYFLIKNGESFEFD